MTITPRTRTDFFALIGALLIISSVFFSSSSSIVYGQRTSNESITRSPEGAKGSQGSGSNTNTQGDSQGGQPNPPAKTCPKGEVPSQLSEGPRCIPEKIANPPSSQQRCPPGQVREVSRHNGITSVSCFRPVCPGGQTPQVSPDQTGFGCVGPLVRNCPAGLWDPKRMQCH